LREVAVAHSSPSPDRDLDHVSGSLEARFAGSEGHCGDRVIRWTTTLSVVVPAVIAAIVSYKHMFVLVHRYGESSWTAALLPLSVDGMIVASSMSLLASSRRGERSGVLPWVLLVIGSTAEPVGERRGCRAVGGGPVDRRLAVGCADRLI
jgi:Protein of unknown function (DUF2637)